MALKQFKSESKRLLDLMINSIYTHHEIFLRELISNASDAIDKLYYHALQDGDTGLNRSDFSITLSADKEARTLTISDNGCGMSQEDLENNLGVIANSGSLKFKNENEKQEDIELAIDKVLDDNDIPYTYVMGYSKDEAIVVKTYTFEIPEEVNE